MRDPPFCRNLWTLECLIAERAEFASVCCGDVHWCKFVFRGCAFLLQVVVSIFFLVVGTACCGLDLGQE